MVHVYVYPPRTGIRLCRSNYGPANNGVASRAPASRHLSRRLLSGLPVASGSEAREGTRHGD